MANITFTSPRMKKDVTVYATAGDTQSLLAVAKVRAAYASILPSRPNNTNANASAMDPATKLKAHWCQKATERFDRRISSRLAAVSSTATPSGRKEVQQVQDEIECTHGKPAGSEKGRSPKGV